MSSYSHTRLYVGNLSASVTEYDLIQLCSKHGKVAKLDYLFHKTGPAKGKPRGYAFVEYSTKDEALRAMVALHDKLVRGRKIIVTAASEQSHNPDEVRLAALSGKGSSHGRTNDASRPTAISLLKGQGVSAAKTTNSKIAALEAKLAALRKDKPSAEPSPEPNASGSGFARRSEGEGGGEKEDAAGWLDSLAPPLEGEGCARYEKAKDEGGAIGVKRTAEAEGQDEDEGEGERKRRKIAVDAAKAGLPARPKFDAELPTPEAAGRPEGDHFRR